jgi:hypothetical protein
MTDFRDKPDAITRWRATVEGLEALVQAAPEAEEIDPAEAEKVRRLIRIRVAAARSNNLPAALEPAAPSLGCGALLHKDRKGDRGS